MQSKDDSQLIYNILSGDDAAFSSLIQKYQKSVHILVWQKIGDFHLAEEITQDTFLIAYQKLATLKNPRALASWLYRIATRQCIVFYRKKEKQIQTQFLEDTNRKHIKEITYSQYIAQEQARIATESQRNSLKKLLARLPKTERTVITLHYFQDMTCQEISQYLDVSVSTIKSHLHRARHRLKNIVYSQ